MKPAEQPGKRPRSIFVGNPLEIHVAALSAMHMQDIGDGNGPRIKSIIASPAAPRPQQGNPNQIVLHTPPVRTAGSVAMTGRTQQFSFSPGRTREKHT